MSETREIADFTTLDIDIAVELEVTKGEHATLQLTMDDNLFPLVMTTVENGRLRITSTENLAFTAPAKIAITVPSLSVVSIAGSVQGSIEELTGPSAELNIAGSADMTIGVTAEELDLEIAGSGSITVTGVCTGVDVSIAGSGTIHAEELQTATAAVSIAGSGKVFVHAIESLDVSVAGSGDVRYLGEPKISQSVMGSGEVSKMQ